jgi:hypothetical protein
MVMSPSRRRRPRTQWLPIIIGIIVVLVASSLVGYTIYMAPTWLASVTPEDDETSPDALKKTGNFGMTVPRGWRHDKDLGKMGANLGMSRSNPRSHLAIRYWDYKTRTPSDAELLADILKKLRPYFHSFEYQTPFTDKRRGRTGELDGEEAIVFRFQGTDKSSETVMDGEVYMLSRRGYAYWFVTWGPQGDERLKQIWETARERFKFANDREGWRPRKQESETFRDADLGIQINYIKGLWEAETNPKDYDTACTLALKGFEPSRDEETGKLRPDRFAGRLATVQVLTLENKADLQAAYQAALEYITKKHKTLYPDTKIELDKKANTNTILNEVGAFRGQISRLRVQLTPDNEKFAMLAVVNQAKGDVVVYCECSYDRRDFWDREFLNLLETVRPTAK